MSVVKSPSIYWGKMGAVVYVQSYQVSLLSFRLILGLGMWLINVFFLNRNKRRRIRGGNSYRRGTR